MSWGDNPGAKGNFILNGTSLAQLPKNQKASGFDRVALDFEHNTVKGSSAYKGEPVLVAGHGTPDLVSGVGLFLNNIEWTAEGRQFVGGRHYIDLSPTILTNSAREVTFLHSAAVCRQGALEGVTILTADALSFLTMSSESSDIPTATVAKLLTKLEAQLNMGKSSGWTYGEGSFLELQKIAAQLRDYCADNEPAQLERAKQLCDDLAEFAPRVAEAEADLQLCTSIYTSYLDEARTRPTLRTLCKLQEASAALAKCSHSPEAAAIHTRTMQFTYGEIELLSL